MSTGYTYYDARSVVLKDSLRTIEDDLRGLGLPVQVAEWPSGHKVWRVRGLGMAPTIRFYNAEGTLVEIEPSTDYTFEHMLGDWEDV